jgi:ribosomal protein S18 acetylase RimI-like enzyme
MPKVFLTDRHENLSRLAGQHLLNRLSGHPHFPRNVGLGHPLIQEALHQVAPLGSELPGQAGVVDGLCSHVLDASNGLLILREIFAVRHAPMTTTHGCQSQPPVVTDGSTRNADLGRLPIMNAATTGSLSAGPVILGAAELTGDTALLARFPLQAHRILADLVGAGAALGWVEPPSRREVDGLLGRVVEAALAGDGALRLAYLDRQLIGLGYWLRYDRPTHRPHADLEKLAVDASAHGRGVGRALAARLIADARQAGIEVLTLDARGDNAPALQLYRSLGFTEYGRLPGFVAVGDHRFDKVLCLIDLRLPE